ncbi:putative beta-lactamase [Vibrio tubiashii ATCC 19109]|nr:putative beta-lactamase [Vibrio tubiashii ATCC 19109]
MAMQDAGDVGLYAAAHISEFLPTTVVSRGGQVSELPTSIIPDIAKVRATTALGDLSVEEMLKDERSRMRAMLVIHKGEIVYEQYPGLRQEDNHLWASATKTIVSLLASQLVEEGKLDLTKSASEYLNPLDGTVWDDVKIEDILNQHSGLDINERSVGVPGHPITDFYRIATGDDSLPEGSAFLGQVIRAEKLREPGTMFEYSSINTFVLGEIIETITQTPLQDLISDRVWKKAGMEGDALLGLSMSGEPAAFGIFASRLSDLGRYAMLYTPSWNKVANEQIVPDRYFESVYKASNTETFIGVDYMGQRMVNNFGTDCIGAAYQWDAVFCDGDLYKSGRTGQAIYVSPETDTVVVWFSSSYKNKIWLEGYAREIVQQVFRK